MRGIEKHRERQAEMYAGIVDRVIITFDDSIQIGRTPQFKYGENDPYREAGYPFGKTRKGRKRWMKGR